MQGISLALVYPYVSLCCLFFVPFFSNFVRRKHVATRFLFFYLYSVKSHFVRLHFASSCFQYCGLKLIFGRCHKCISFCMHRERGAESRAMTYFKPKSHSLRRCFLTFFNHHTTALLACFITYLRERLKSQ